MPTEPHDHYHLYVVDDQGRSMVIRDSHNVNGNRCWVLPLEDPFTIVLELDGYKTLLVVDEDGDLHIELEDPPEPEPEPPKKKRRRSRFLRRDR